VKNGVYLFQIETYDIKIDNIQQIRGVKSADNKTMFQYEKLG